MVKRAPMDYLRRALTTPPHRSLLWIGRRLRTRIILPLALMPWRPPPPENLARALGVGDSEELWQTLAGAPFPGDPGPRDGQRYEELFPADRDRILRAAEDALAHRVDLLGSGPVALGETIDWHRDYKTGYPWPVIAAEKIDYAVLDEGCDVKFPWELSRFQWLIPVAQAYLLTGDDRYPTFVRDIVENWIDANPYGLGINWLIGMEAALRGIALVWLFRAFHDAPTWRDAGFRERYLHLVYLHGHFIERHLEPADVNGNHFTADAAGLVILGLFFGRGTAPDRWHRGGWRMLSREISRQVHPDGVDFEASTAYHRLVLELFLLPAVFRTAHGLNVPEYYRRRLAAMAGFARAYSRTDGSTPLWGDADDGRVLPFGGQDVNDHRYLTELVSRSLGGGEFAEPSVEAFWLLGDPGHGAKQSAEPGTSTGFPDGGVYIMRHENDHVFIDCGPVGLGERGGHGHNDCLSFEAVLQGVPLIVDCGSYVYTASVDWRNRFRGTGFHNTPMIDGEEQNRFPHPEFLWLLRNDARHLVQEWRTENDRDIFVGSHTGYERLANPVTPIRKIILDKPDHRLIVLDRFEGDGPNHIAVPFHLAPGVACEPIGPDIWQLEAAGSRFLFVSNADGVWETERRPAWFSPSYGIRQEISAIEFFRSGNLRPLACAIIPSEKSPDDPVDWLRTTLLEREYEE